MEWKFLDPHKTTKKTLRQSPTPLLPPPPPLLLHPPTQHVQIQQSRQTRQIAELHVLPQRPLQTR